jgi:hypothetical protein
MVQTVAPVVAQGQPKPEELETHLRHPLLKELMVETVLQALLIMEAEAAAELQQREPRQTLLI